jgi:hypothetical protein
LFKSSYIKVANGIVILSPLAWLTPKLVTICESNN